VEHQHFEEAAPIYAAGGLDSEDREEFEEHLETGCSICLKIIKEYHETMGLDPDTLPPTESPPPSTSPEMKPFAIGPKHLGHAHGKERWIDRLLKWIPPVFSSSIFTTILLVLLVLLVSLIVYTPTPRSDLVTELEQKRQQVELALEERMGKLALLQQQVTQQAHMVEDLREKQNQQIGNLAGVKELTASQKAEVNQLREQLAQQEEESILLRRTLEQKEAVVSVLLSPSVKAVSLTGKKQSPAKAFLLFDPEKKTGLFYAFNLASLPKGKTYQLWALMRKPVSIGTFKLDGGGKGRLFFKNLENFSRIKKFAVSIEPSGGGSKPTGTLQLLSSI
jgi:anti-sigma-K factor RskA